MSVNATCNPFSEPAPSLPIGMAGPPWRASPLSSRKPCHHRGHARSGDQRQCPHDLRHPDSRNSLPLSRSSCLRRTWGADRSQPLRVRFGLRDGWNRAGRCPRAESLARRSGLGGSRRARGAGGGTASTPDVLLTDASGSGPTEGAGRAGASSCRTGWATGSEGLAGMGGCGLVQPATIVTVASTDTDLHSDTGSLERRSCAAHSTDR